MTLLNLVASTEGSVLFFADSDWTLHGYVASTGGSVLLVGASKLLQIRSWCPLILQSTPDEKSVAPLFLSRRPWREISYMLS